MATKKSTGSHQTTEMKKLTQQAAAWLVGMTGRNLRDRPDVPRNEDGTYNGQELLAWARTTGPRPQVGDDALERVHQAVEFGLLDGDTTCHEQVLEVLDELRTEHGDSGLLLFVDVLAQSLRTVSIPDRVPAEPPSGTLTTAETRALVLEEVERRNHKWARDHLRFSIRCESCGRYRNGRTWRKGEPPSPCVVLLGECGECANATS